MVGAEAAGASRRVRVGCGRGQLTRWGGCILLAAAERRKGRERIRSLVRGRLGEVLLRHGWASFGSFRGGVGPVVEKRVDAAHSHVGAGVGTQSWRGQLRIAGDSDDEDDAGEVCRREGRREGGSGVENNAVSISLGAALDLEGARNSMHAALPSHHSPTTTHDTRRSRWPIRPDRPAYIHTANIRCCVESHPAQLVSVMGPMMQHLESFRAPLSARSCAVASSSPPRDNNY